MGCDSRCGGDVAVAHGEDTHEVVHGHVPPTRALPSQRRRKGRDKLPTRVCHRVGRGLVLRPVLAHHLDNVDAACAVEVEAANGLNHAVTRRNLFEPVPGDCSSEEFATSIARHAPSHKISLSDMECDTTPATKAMSFFAELLQGFG